MIIKKNIKTILARAKKFSIFLGGNNFLKLRKNAYFGLFFILASLALAALIAWQAVYFLFFLAAVLFLAIVFWKTEESLIALVFYLPFQIALNVTESIDMASSRIFVIVLFLAWLIKSLAKKKLIIPYGMTTWLLAIFLGLAALSAYFSIDQGKSAIRLLFFFSIIPLYFISAAYLNSTIKITKVIYVLLFSSSIAAIAGIVQFLSQFIFGIDAIMDFWSKNIAYLFYGQSFGKIVVANPSWLVNVGGETLFRAISFFPDPHMFSFYLGLAAPIALSLAFFSNIFNLSNWRRFLLYICNAVIFLALVLTFSRAGYVGAFFGIAAIIFLGWKFFNKRIKFIIGAVVLIGGIVVFNSSSAVVSRFFSSFNLSEGSNSERLLNWRQSIKIIEDYPATGAGVGAYAEAVNARASERSSITAHNTYFDIAAEMGIPALLIWIIILILTIKKFISILRSRDCELSKEKVISLGMIGALVWFSVQMFFDTAIYSPVLLALLMVYLAISVNLGKKVMVK
ncbi:O-antigen ligase family protein [Patescibacteria group bacterium]|nr:O-antigen ligase family protein [Patescibacteria group bacterium]